MAAYRCEYLFMLKFRIVFLSLTKKVYALHTAGYIINLIIWSQWCQNVSFFNSFIVHFTFQ